MLILRSVRLRLDVVLTEFRLSVTLLRSVRLKIPDVSDVVSMLLELEQLEIDSDSPLVEAGAHVSLVDPVNLPVLPSLDEFGLSQSEFGPSQSEFVSSVTSHSEFVSSHSEFVGSSDLGVVLVSGSLGRKIGSFFGNKSRF